MKREREGMRGNRRSLRVAMSVFTIGGTIGILGCNPLAPALKQAKDLLDANQGSEAVVVIVMPDTKTYPEHVIIQKSNHVIVWLALADRLDVDFKGSTLVSTKCKDAICWTTISPNQEASDIPYGVTVTTKGVPVSRDPHLEIVK
jgi:hypothetical protein